ITVPALTLLGASDEPGMCEGTIPLPPSMARSLAGNEQTWYRVLTDGATGAFLPLPAEKYVPTNAMLEHLRLRHSMCAVPGCTRPTSWASECDHIEACLRGTAGEGGLTEIENLHLLCWQHPPDKTNGLPDPTRLPTTPTPPGRTRSTTPPDCPPPRPSPAGPGGASAPAATLSPSSTTSTLTASRSPKTSPRPGPATSAAPTPPTRPPTRGRHPGAHRAGPRTHQAGPRTHPTPGRAPARHPSDQPAPPRQPGRERHRAGPQARVGPRRAPSGEPPTLRPWTRTSSP